MEINRAFYTNPQDDNNACTQFNSFTDMPVNTEFDISGAYGLTDGQYSPWCNVGVAHGGDYSIIGGYHYNMTTLNTSHTFNNLPMFLCVGNTRLPPMLGYNDNNYYIPYERFDDLTKGHDISSYASGYNYGISYHWAPNAQSINVPELSDTYGTGGIFTGFSYRNIVLYPTIIAYKIKPAPGSSGWYGDHYAGGIKDYDPSEYPYITRMSWGYYLEQYPTSETEQTPSRGSVVINNNNISRYPIGATPISYNFPKINVTNSEGVYKTTDYTSMYVSAYNLNGVTDLLPGGMSGVTSVYNDQSYCGRGKLIALFNFAHFEYAENHTNTFYWWECSKEDLLHIFATFGLYFATTAAAASKAVTGENATDPDLYLAVADNDGVYRGKYANGEDIPNEKNADWGDPDKPFDWWKNNGVSPKPKPGDETDKTALSKPSISAFGSFNRAFAMTQSTLNALQNYLWNRSDTVFDEIVAGLKLFGENPMNAIVDCRMYPFDVLSYIGSSGAQKITLGRRETSVTGVYLGNTTNCIIDLGSVEWVNYTNSFLDNAPYSGAELYVPYVGRFSLDPNIYAGRTVQCYLIVDFMTGSCQAVVFADGIAYDYKSGQIGVDVPISGVNAAQWAAGIVGGVAGTANAILGVGGQIAAGNPLGAGYSAINAINSAVQTSTTFTPTVQQAGTATASTGQWLPQRAYLTVHVPIHIESNMYGHCVGYACNMNAQIGSLSGFVVCSNVDLSGILATNAERDELVNILTSGFYV